MSVNTFELTLAVGAVWVVLEALVLARCQFIMAEHLEVRRSSGSSEPCMHLLRMITYSPPASCMMRCAHIRVHRALMILA